MITMARLGNLERDVMDQIWAASAPVTVRDVHEALAVERDLAYTTVMTVLDRLAKKGVVHRVRDGRAYRYQAASGKDQLVADLMREALDAAGNRASREAALVRFVDQASADEAKALREALAALESKAELDGLGGLDGSASKTKGKR
jgi:predicted transcriptional regulator